MKNSALPGAWARPLAVAMGAIAVGVVLFLGDPWAAAQGDPAVRPAQSPKVNLRNMWGEPDLSGVWKAAKVAPTIPGQDRFNLAQLERLYTPAARAKMKEMSAKDDPTVRCVPSAFPRAAMFGTPIQIVQIPGFAFVFTEEFPMVRQIPTNGRPHLESNFLYPVFMGDSTGRWEGDTLVVDVISFNGESWLAGSEDKPTKTSNGIWPTSEEMHVIERWRRVDADTLEYQASVEDPRMLPGRWETPKVAFRRQPKDRIEENLCLMFEGYENYLKRAQD